MLNFAICDDNEHILNKMCSLFESAFSKGDFEGKIVFRTTDCNEIVNYISSNRVDVVVLDIQFNNVDKTGLDIAEQIRKINKKCYIIFTTSHIEYIMQAYKFKTFDYLIKSAITIDVLIDTLQRLYDDISGTTVQYVKIDSKGTIIDVNDIQFIEKDGMRLVYHTTFSKHEVYTSFSKIQDKLPKHFVRCHKSYIANIKNISSIAIADNLITFKNNEVCYIGPKYKDTFMEVFRHDTIFE